MKNSASLLSQISRSDSSCPSSLFISLQNHKSFHSLCRMKRNGLP
jgi:hypothetical protein